MIKKIKIGDVKKFMIVNPNWVRPVEAEGKVVAFQPTKFKGMVMFTDVKILDDMLIRCEQIS
jgi:hypothetical protein